MVIFNNSIFSGLEFTKQYLGVGLHYFQICNLCVCVCGVYGVSVVSVLSVHMCR